MLGEYLVINSVTHCVYFQEFYDAETLELPDSSTQPEPPPRSDSHGTKLLVQARHMVDMLTDYEQREKFSWDTHREYLLTCMGFVNGIGCLLKSAVLTMKHGGGKTVVSFLICFRVMIVITFNSGHGKI